ncbi:MAG TPA: hypothetical protein VKE22_09455 [Haliangiales bacterium]|nr:hypothetical protein [Haliangiales bacterium]
MAIACAVVLTGAQALAHHEEGGWDPRGWERLGDLGVASGGGAYVVRVGRDEGIFTQLALSVEGNDIDVADLVVTFADGGRYAPNQRFHFRGGATATVDVPGGARGIRAVELRAAGGPARLILWGKLGYRPPPPQPPPPQPPPPQPPPPPQRPPVWNPSGWERLGERTVDGRYDRDILRVGPRDGVFTTLMLVVEDGDLDMYDMVVTFGNGERFAPPLRFRFREGTRTGAIDLPGAARVIQSIEFRYGNIPGYGRARVEVWGKPGGFVPPPPRPSPPPPPPEWDPSGWTLIAETTVNGRYDRDFVKIRGGGRRFSQIVIAVRNGELEMYDMTIFFRDGGRFSPDMRFVFGERARTRVIDLPGGARRIRGIGFSYGNVGGGYREARVEVFAR